MGFQIVAYFACGSYPCSHGVPCWESSLPVGCGGPGRVPTAAWRLQCGCRHVAAGEDRRVGTNALAGTTGHSCRPSAHCLPPRRDGKFFPHLFLSVWVGVTLVIIFLLYLYYLIWDHGKYFTVTQGFIKYNVLSIFRCHILYTKSGISSPVLSSLSPLYSPATLHNPPSQLQHTTFILWSSTSWQAMQRVPVIWLSSGWCSWASRMPRGPVVWWWNWGPARPFVWWRTWSSCAEVFICRGRMARRYQIQSLAWGLKRVQWS